MDLEEAHAWLRGERSWTNRIMDAESDPEKRPETLALIEVADAGAMWQALAVVQYAQTHQDQPQDTSCSICGEFGHDWRGQAPCPHRRERKIVRETNCFPQ